MRGNKHKIIVQFNFNPPEGLDTEEAVKAFLERASETILDSIEDTGGHGATGTVTSTYTEQVSHSFTQESEVPE